MSTNKIDSFVVVPRSIVQDYRNRKLTRTEFDVYIWVRLNGNPYGTAVTSLSDINDDVFGGKIENNSVNKILISLKEKRYIYYERRSGRRGSFNVEFGDWILPSKAIRSLDRFFEAESVRSEVIDKEPKQSEVSQSKPIASQTLTELKNAMNALASSKSISKAVRGTNNDTDTYKDKETNRASSPLKRKDSESFIPQNYDEERCKEIALELGEDNMAFLLATKAKHGFPIIVEAYTIYNQEKFGKDIKNSGAYFNSIVQRITSDKPVQPFEVSHAY